MRLSDLSRPYITVAAAVEAKHLVAGRRANVNRPYFHSSQLSLGRRPWPAQHVRFPVSAEPAAEPRLGVAVRPGPTFMDQQPAPGAHPRATGPGKRQSEPSDEAVDVLARSIQLGAGAGACGILFGATSSIIRGVKTPVLFSLVSGFQWFGISSVFYGARKLAIARYGPEHNVTPAQKVGASAIAGAVSVVPVGLLLRGPRSILPGSVIFSLLGAGGQIASNRWSGSENSPKSSGWFTSKWSPMTKLSDEEYKVMLEEKILRVEADLAILDENKAVLLAEEQAKIKAAEEPSSKE